ncbi:unnamed protein product [Miscanthus lutarioriparius]|uniref:Uncharacterized protein n=1 Tax=Miscanthus lutarioriparius TaxID=422564 RepID=A0A811QKQ5_9POAL|nr:unnamed protein product [Miscanthus lutarioriparius]
MEARRTAKPRRQWPRAVAASALIRAIVAAQIWPETVGGGGGLQEDFSTSPLEILPSRAHPDWTREDGNAFAREHKQIFGPASLVGGGLTSERERMAAQVFQTGYRFCPMRMKNPTDASI